MTTLSILPAALRRRMLQRPEIDRLLITSTSFSCTLVLLRIFHTHSLQFVGLAWNLLLAYLPYLLSSWLTVKRQRRPVVLILVATWLLFIPNTFYILTDLYHLHDSRHARSPEWFDLALIFSFAWNGLLLGVLSVRQMEKLLLPAADKFRSKLFLYPVLFLCALGVYAGRYLRFNSWDILSNPLQLAADMMGMVIHPLKNESAWSMVLCYTILLSFIYNMLKKMSQALA